MSVIIDTGVLYASVNKSDQDHRAAQTIIRDILDKQYGQAFASDYIIDEAVTLTHARTKDRLKSTRMLDSCLNSPELFRILKVETTDFNNAADHYRQSDELSFTDCTTLALMRRHDIRNIATFDGGFQRIKNIQVIDQ